MNNFELWFVDSETTGVDEIKNDPIEISLMRASTNEQRTWCLKPINFETIQPEALRINKHSLDDLKGLTKEGRERYQEPAKVLIEIENWVMESGVPSDSALLVGHNAQFDKGMLMRLWEKCNASGTFPFSKKYSLCTMQIQLAMDIASGTVSDSKGYSLGALTKKFGIKNEKAHSAAADTLAMKELFMKQMEFLSSKLK